MTGVLTLDPQYAWTEERRGLTKIAWTGRENTVLQIIAILPDAGAPDLGLLAACLGTLPGHFALLLEGDDWALAIADKVASYPIFFYLKNQRFLASNSARLLQQSLNLSKCNNSGLLEFRLGGYVSGNETLQHHLFKLRAGEFVLWKKNDAKLSTIPYYVFHSHAIRGDTEAELIDDLDARTNAVIDRHIEDAGGRPVVVPLSGGLDSRIVLAKLRLRGCENLWTFSYGVPGNYEAKVAKHVADKIGVPWIFIPTTRAQARTFFFSETRRNYWEFADGLHVIPNLHTFLALQTLRNSGHFERGAIIVNGQSGDFISGDHIPPEIMQEKLERNQFYSNIIDKHYSQRRSLVRDASVRAAIRQRIEMVLKGPAAFEDPQQYAKTHELWEWQTRQSIRVLNGQRNYDYFGLSWELPLWEREYLDFWSAIPLAHKMQRRLFRRWLEREDFYGLFREFKPFLSRWPRHLLWIQHLGRGLKLFLGPKISARYYEMLDYYSHYSYLYAEVRYLDYLLHCHDYRGTYPHYGDVWEREWAHLFDGGVGRTS